MRRRIIAIPMTLAVAASLVAVPGAASAATKKTATPPSITRVLPMRIKVGERLTIMGRNFSRTKTKNTIIFRAPSGRTAFAKPATASANKLVVSVPGAVTRLLAKSAASTTKPTRFKLRVLSGTFSKFTPRRLSPVIVGEAAPKGGSGGKGGGNAGGGTQGGAGSPNVAPSCNASPDHDGDLIPNDLELQLKTDPCLKDTDGDGVEDGFEYRSAIDLNDDEFQDPNMSLPFPGKRPYPNPLDPSDPGYDFDGDVLTLTEEQGLWYFTIANGAPRTLTPLTYSDGKQYSIDQIGGDNRRYPALATAGYSKQVGFLNWASAAGYRKVLLDDDEWAFGPGSHLYELLDFDRSGAEDATATRSESDYYDFDRNAFLSDDERDEDGDGLTNYDETHGRLTPQYWAECYGNERPHPVPYAGTSVVDSDSDGDGVLDGADDQDHDDIPNVMEMSRVAASADPGLFDGERICKPLQSLPSPPSTNHPSAYGRVNPFNPCLPAVFSRTCTRHPNLGGDGAPFDDSLNWASLN